MRKLVALLAAGVLMAGTATLVIWFQLRAERERGAELAARASAPESAEVAQMVAAGPALQAPADPSDVTAAPTRAPAPPLRSSLPESSATAAVLPPKATPAIAASAADPISGMMKSMMRQMYPDLAAELDLSPAQAEQFLELFISQQAQNGTQFIGLMGGGSMDAAQRQRLQQQMVDKERADEGELRKVLGSKYPRWEEYQSIAEARQQVNQLRTALATGGKPLTEPQSQALVAAFAADASRSRDDERAWMATDAARNSPNLMRERMQRQIEGQRRLVDLAAPHLDGTQLEHFRRQNEQAVIMATSMLGMMGSEK
jgi:hypothetical protein